MLNSTIFSVDDAAVFSGPRDGSSLLAPAADSEALSGQLAGFGSVTLIARFVIGAL